MSTISKSKESTKETVELNVSPFQYLPDAKIKDPDRRLDDVLSKFKEIYSNQKDIIVVLPESLFKEIYIYDRRSLEKQAAEKAYKEMESGSKRTEREITDEFMLENYEKFIAWEKEAQKSMLQVIKQVGVNTVLCGTDFEAQQRLEKEEVQAGALPQKKFVNAAFFVNDHGEILHTYHKQNFVPEEFVDYRPGDRTIGNFIFEFHGKTIPMGLIICADGEKKEIADKLLLGQPSLVLNPANCSPDGCTKEKTYLKQSGENSKENYMVTYKPISDVVPMMRSEPPEPVCNGSSMFLYKETAIRPEFPYGNWTPIQSVKVKFVPKAEALANLEKVTDLDRKSKTEKVLELLSTPEGIPASPEMEVTEAASFDAPSMDVESSTSEFSPPPPPPPSPPATKSAKKWTTEKMAGKHVEPKIEKKEVSEAAEEVVPPPLSIAVTVRGINSQEGGDRDYMKNFLEPIASDKDKTTLHVLGYDFDGTLNYFTPETLTKPKNLQRGQILGGDAAREHLQTIVNKGGVLKIISALQPSPSNLGMLININFKFLDENAEGPRVSDLFGIREFPIKEKEIKQLKETGLDPFVKEVEFSANNGIQHTVPMQHFKNIILAKYDKGAALVEALRDKLLHMTQEEREKLKTIKVHFLDDYVANPYEAAKQFIENIKSIEKLCPNAKIEIDSAWLQLKPKLGGGESSYTEEFEAYRHNTSQIRNMPAEEFLKRYPRFQTEYYTALEKPERPERLERTERSEKPGRAERKERKEIAEPKRMPLAAKQQRSVEAQSMQGWQVERKPSRPAISFTTAPKPQPEPEPLEGDIVKAAQRFKSAASRKGKKFEEFKAKLGLGKDENIVHIAESRIQVERKGKKSWESIQDLYNKQQKVGKQKPRV